MVAVSLKKKKKKKIFFFFFFYFFFFFFFFFYFFFFFGCFFFFQAEDGIRDRDVTGVQTCALPILCSYSVSAVVFGISLRRMKLDGLG